MLDEFIEQIHKNADGLIEFREISSRGEAVAVFKTSKELSQYEPPQDKNVYVGMFTRAKRSGKATNCVSTNVLWADYDRASLEEVKRAIEQANMPAPSIYVNSGYGVHAYWILNERIGHEAQLVVKAIAEATGADTKATDIARIMRLPGTNNVKNGDCKPCRVLEISHRTHDINEIKNAVQVKYKASKGRSNIATGKPCIDAMLNGVGKGHRNFALGRITKQLQLQGYTRAKALEETLKFNDRCKPPKNEAEVVQDFNAYWEGDYKLIGCKIPDTKLQGILSGYCDFSKCKNQATDVFNVNVDNSISYDNRTVFKDYGKLSGNELIILGILKKYPHGLNRSRLEALLYSPGAKQSLVNNRTLEKTLHRLHGLKLVELRKEAKDRGNNYNNYFVKCTEQINYGWGFTLVSNGAIMGAIDRRITPNQYKLYVLLLKYGYSKGEAYPSTITIAETMGTSQPNVVREIKALEKVGYVEKSYTYHKGVKSCNYRLLL